MKYHINPETGRPNQCTASIRHCKYAVNGVIPEHYQTKEEARTAYEEKMSKSSFTVLKKKPLTLEEKSEYQKNILSSAYEKRIPINNLELSKRYEYVDEITKKLISEGRTTTQLNSHWGKYTPEREKQHQEIFEEYITKSLNVKHDGEVIFSGGLCGAGKSTVLKDYVNINNNDYITISADDIKEIMSEKGMIPSIHGLTPMESAGLAHEESLKITDDIVEELAKTKTNIIMDMSMNKSWAVIEKTDLFNGYDYQKFRVVFVDVTPDTSLQRSEIRYADGMNKYTVSHEGPGGRFLPPNIIKKQQSYQYKSVNAENLIELYNEGIFHEEPLIFDNEGTEPKAIDYKDFVNEKI